MVVVILVLVYSLGVVPWFLLSMLLSVPFCFNRRKTSGKKTVYIYMCVCVCPKAERTKRNLEN